MNDPVGLKKFDKLLPYLLLLPAFSIAMVILVYPFVNGLILSFTSYSLIQPEYIWVGFKNYIQIFSDPIYYEVVFNSFFILLIGTAVPVLIGLVLALLFDRPNLFLGVQLRGLVFIIWIIPMVVVALIWRVIFNADFGIMNFMLERAGLLHHKLRWFAGDWSARFAMIITYSWRSTPFFMVMILAALQTIPQTIVESAVVEGSTAVQRFFYIKFHYLKKIIFLAALLNVVRLFQDITLMYVQTGGGPGYSTTTLALHVYKYAFNNLQSGIAASIGVTWLVFLLILAGLYMRILQANED